MAFARSSTRRRRSRSASVSSPTVRRSSDFSLRVAAKRVYPILSPCNISLPLCWDINWRHGKRKCYSFSSPETSKSFPEVPEQHDTLCTTVRSGFTLPSSSAAFNFFPKSNRSSRRHASYSPPGSEPGLSNLSQSELTHLRSSAFWELHQSIIENGEGFVQRMRDYEHVRSRQSLEPTRPPRKRLHPQTTPHTADTDESDDEEDIQILAGDLSTNPSSRSPRSIKVPYHRLRSGEQEHNQFLHQNQPPSMMFEGNSLPTTFDSPVSSSAFSFSSTNPSLLSSPIQSQHPDSDISSSIFSSFSPPDSNPSLDRTPTLSSDKTISEITLALANGAGAIRDYSHLQNLTSFENIGAGESGELWH